MQGAIDFWNGDQVHVLVHHSPCDDGHAAAAAFYHALSPSVTMVGLHPSAHLLTDEVRDLITGRNVVFVDIAFSASVMLEAAALARKVVVLDHHVTNQTSLQSISAPNMRIVFEMDIAGVRLAWRFLHGDEKQIPLALYYIALKDVWQHESVPEALYFTTAFVRPATLPEWAPYFDAHSTATADLIEKGRIVYEYQQQVLTIMMEKVHYTTWRGFRVAIVNVPYPWISDIGAMMCREDPEHTIAVVWNKPAVGPYAVSLRSHNPLGPNIEPIALEFGGGGHVHGAGLRFDRPPFEVFSE